MRIKLILAAAVAASFPLQGVPASLPPDTPLIVDGDVKIDAGDIEGYMLRVPEQHRVQVRASHERVATMADNVFVARAFAAKARAAGLDRDVAVQRRLVQVQEALLADLYLQHLDKTAPEVNLEARARELYIGEQAKYVKPEEVYIEHILIGLHGRTREMAQERAKKVYAEALSGKERFLDLAARYSDDPEKKRNGGDLGYNSPKSFVEPITKRLATMTRKGEISEPLESHMGFHLIRFVERKKEEQIKFEDVKKALIAGEKDRLAKKRHEEALAQVRGSKTVVVHREKVEALVVPIDDILSKAAAAAAAEPPKAR